MDKLETVCARGCVHSPIFNVQSDSESTLIIVSSLMASAANLRIPSDSFSTAMRSSLCSQRKAFSSMWTFSRSQALAAGSKQTRRSSSVGRVDSNGHNSVQYEARNISLWPCCGPYSHKSGVFLGHWLRQLHILPSCKLTFNYLQTDTRLGAEGKWLC